MSVKNYQQLYILSCTHQNKVIFKVIYVLIYLEVAQVQQWLGCPKTDITISYGPIKITQAH